MDTSYNVEATCFECPRRCGALRGKGERGFCGANDQLCVARAALHYWEEPPISGTSGSGTVFFTHCSLRCVYCQNSSLVRSAQGHLITPAQLAKICLGLQEQGALNINMVTPTHYGPQIREALHLAKPRLTLPIVWNTSGYETIETIEHNRGFVDVYLTDFKYASSELAQRYSHAADYPNVALKALEAMIDAVGEPRFDEYHGQTRMISGVLVRHMLLPSSLEHSKQVVRLLYQRFGDAIMLSLMNQYTPVLATAAHKGDGWAQRQLTLHPELAFPVPESEYEQLLDYADSLGIEDYFWQQGKSCLESFIPDFDDGVIRDFLD